jgi:branched-chain amino acid transport system ATP-binding protein
VSEILLDVQEAVVRHGEVAAVDRVSIAVRQGEAVALLGANGAGKSTLLKAIIGQVGLAGGSIRFAGHELNGLAPWQRARLGIGYSAEGRRVFPAMTVRENLEVAGEGDRRERARRIEDVIRIFPALGLNLLVPAWRLSGGQQQMLAIGRALMRSARLVILDEPSLGLSPILANETFALLRALTAAGSAVLVADQNAVMALPAVDRAYVMQTGRVIAEGSAAELMRREVLTAALFG